MTRIKQAGPAVLVVAVIAGAIGYILGCTQTQREDNSEARAEQDDRVASADDTTKRKKPGPGDNGEPLVSPTEARARDFYAPNSETLAPDEMRIIACGTGMPYTRMGQ